MTPNRSFRIVLMWLFVAALLLGGTLQPVRVAAQSAAPVTGLAVLDQEGSVRVHWQAGVQAADDTRGLPRQVYGGYLLPMQTVVVELPADGGVLAAGAPVQLAALTSVPYVGPLTDAPEEMPPALDWEPFPSDLPVVEKRLPSAPLFVLHEGMQRHRRLAVLAFSPIYQDPASGEIRHVEQLDAVIAGAVTASASLDDPTAAPDNEALFAPVAALADAPGPSNPLAARNGVVKLLVTQPGLQEVTAAQLAAAGMTSPNPARLRLFHEGVEVPLHLTGAGGGLPLRFYAPTAGDTWNKASIYWLVVDANNGLRMTTQDRAPAAATPRDTALEPGRYQDNKLFFSNILGADNDNWFSFITDTQPNSSVPPADASAQVTLRHRLTIVLDAVYDLSARLTLHVTAHDTRPPRDRLLVPKVPYRLAVRLGAQTQTDGPGDWIIDFGMGTTLDFTRHFSFNTGATDLTLTLLAGPQRHRVLFDAIDYLLPVRLDFNGQGAIFQGVDGTWRYELTRTPNNRVLYDITDPAAPIILNVPAGADFAFQDGPEPRRYLLSGNGVVHTPQAVAHTAFSFPARGAAHTVYITPKEFMAALQPLVELRRSQGYQVAVVDVQTIYDAWSFGRVDPVAIRNFLRYVVGNWRPAPIAAVLVGDGTWDPHDYLGFGHTNYIPPYLANVDPWIAVTACENCYAQLNGDDPLDETAFMIDMWVGRFPVNSVSELTGVVTKIVDYETDPHTTAPWRRRALQIVDDYVRPDGTLDGAGNFWESVHHVTRPLLRINDAEFEGFQPEDVEILRHYFLAETALPNLRNQNFFKALPVGEQNALVNWVEGIRPWSTSDRTETQQRTLELMNSGVGLVTFTGHSNHYFYATLYQLPDGFFNLNDVARLNNRRSPFIMLTMTCYTSQFPKPDPRPTTVDERLFLHPNGGAIAVFGPAGLSVASGHDKLQEGFYRTLWRAQPQQAKMGALLEAGYRVVSASAAHLDVNKTYLLLGDPLTSARVSQNRSLWLPAIQR